MQDVKQTLDGDAKAYFDANKGKIVDAIVERVRDGSTVQVILLPSLQTITLQLSGIKAPTYRKDIPNQPDQIEPFGGEAKYFTESRLLQQDVKVILEGFSNNNFVGTVIHPNGNISEALVKEGFAKVVDWSITLVTGGPKNLVCTVFFFVCFFVLFPTSTDFGHCSARPKSPPSNARCASGRTTSQRRTAVRAAVAESPPAEPSLSERSSRSSTASRSPSRTTTSSTNCSCRPSASPARRRPPKPPTKERPRSFCGRASSARRSTCTLTTPSPPRRVTKSVSVPRSSRTTSTSTRLSSARDSRRSSATVRTTRTGRATMIRFAVQTCVPES